MTDRLRFFLKRMAEKLWVKPLIFCVVSVGVAFLAKVVDGIATFDSAPQVNPDSVEMLLKTISSSMLVMAVFAVGSMLAAYQSASSSATPRSFSLVIADDVSQNALSTFIGAFIFSIVAHVALTNGYYGNAGRFLLFIITILVFVLVILSFLRWVDRIARLGRVGTIIAKVEGAAQDALLRQIESPYLGGVSSETLAGGIPVFSSTVGYVQRIDMDSLQQAASKADVFIRSSARPGKFVTPDQPLFYIIPSNLHHTLDMDKTVFIQAFEIGEKRSFDDDPRFGLITLSEIGSRALSPAVNDPGTAIEIIGIFVRLFSKLAKESHDNKCRVVEFDRIGVPPMPMADLFEDAFHAIARDGAGTIEVVIRLLKAQSTLASLNNTQMTESAINTKKLILAHADEALTISAEKDTVRSISELER